MEEVDENFLKILGNKTKINIENDINISNRVNKLLKLISKLDNITK